MNEPKPFASLGPTLLARKGGAKPAMRPQLAPMGMGSGGGNAQAARALAQDFDALEDLGWNDMGEDEAPADRLGDLLQLTPAPPNPEAEAETDAGSPKPHLPVAEARIEPIAPIAPKPAPEALPEVIATKPVRPAVEAAPKAAAETPAPKPLVRSIHEELAERLEKGETEYPVRKVKQPKQAATVVEAPAPRPEPAPAALEDVAEANRRAAFTLRLDAKRHLKLRLASTVRNRSAQQLVTEALDRFLRDIPEVELLARNIQHNGRKRG